MAIPMRAVTGAISRREEFRSGDLRGVSLNWMPQTGKLDPALVAELDATVRDNRNHGRPTYVVIDYSTPIAWTSGWDHVLVVPEVRYSATTARHQTLCRAASRSVAAA